MKKNTIKLTESQFKNMIQNIISETVEHFRTKWDYADLGPIAGKTYDPWDNELLDKMDGVVEKYGWEIAPMSKSVERKGKKYNAYICIPNENAPRIGEWAFVAASLNTLANQYGMTVEHGKYKGILTNVPEEEAKPKRIKRGAEPAAEVDKSGAHYFIIKPRSESNI